VTKPPEIPPQRNPWEIDRIVYVSPVRGKPGLELHRNDGEVLEFTIEPWLAIKLVEYLTSHVIAPTIKEAIRNA
jgi:hypothetical protein